MHELARRHLRSVLFTRPGDPGRVELLAASGADAIVFDLEGLVNGELSDARSAAAESIERFPLGPAVMVRTETVDAGALDDMSQTLSARLDAFVLPSIEHEHELRWADGVLAFAEQQMGRVVGSIAVLAIIETARGLARCERIFAEAPARVVGSIVGVRDLSLDLGLVPTQDRSELRHARSRMVTACRAKRMAPPIDGPSLHHRDQDGFVGDCLASRAEGFQGRVTADLAQIPWIRSAYAAHPRDDVAAVRSGMGLYDGSAVRGEAFVESPPPTRSESG